ncbi:MAG: PaaI family thioesterase [Porticoccaceae bacterium]|nr:PaaI family thioesterase [Porticoccaceae bacterium]
MTDKALMERIVHFRSKPENQSPFALYLGLEIVDIDKGEATVSVPYAKHLAGNSLTGVLHGGIITTTLDAVCGLSVIAALGEPTTIATLDLRIDYLKPASPDEAVFAYGHCYKVTKNVCFVRGLAYQKDKSKPIANATATFMITAKGTGRKVQKNAQPELEKEKPTT